MRQDARIFVAGSRGLVGSAIVRRLEAVGPRGFSRPPASSWICAIRPRSTTGSAPTGPSMCTWSPARSAAFSRTRSRPAEFIYDNMLIHATVVHAAHQYGVKKLLYLGSSCIYPRMAPQPMKEEHLLTGLLEPTNEPYAIAKIAGIKLCEAYRKQYGANFISAMPTNLYGQNDNFDLDAVARAAGADSQVPRRESGRTSREVDDLGHRHAAPRVPARRRSRRRVRVPDGALRRARAHQRRHRRGSVDPRARRRR